MSHPALSNSGHQQQDGHTRWSQKYFEVKIMNNIVLKKPIKIEETHLLIIPYAK